MTTTPSITLERRRTGWDIAFGILSVLAGMMVLGHVAFFGLISVLFVGWMLLFGGVALVVGGIVRWKVAAHRWDVAVGALLGILGLGLVRSPAAGLAVLTLLAGSLLLAGGVLRLVAAFQPGAPRGLLIFNGAITLLLGGMVLFQWPVSALWFLGTVLGVQLILDGVTTALSGRVRATVVNPAEDTVHA